jgi:hypothetical protein
MKKIELTGFTNTETAREREKRNSAAGQKI